MSPEPALSDVHTTDPVADMPRHALPVRQDGVVFAPGDEDEQVLLAAVRVGWLRAPVGGASVYTGATVPASSPVPGFLGVTSSSPVPLPTVPQASTRSESAILPQGWMPVRVAPAPTRSALIPAYPCSHHAPPR